MGCIFSLCRDAKEDGSESPSTPSRPSGDGEPVSPIYPDVTPDMPFNLPQQESKNMFPTPHPNAVRALRHDGNDFVISFMELTM